MKTLLIDNYDSFTFNLFQLLAEVNGEEPYVVRNDGATWEELSGWDVDSIVLSPGPGRPDRPGDFGVCAEAIRSARVPLLGVCLGHQGLASAFGGSVAHAPEVMHGRLSAVYHDGSELFAGLPQGFRAVRYHSLCVGRPLPDELEATAWTADGVIMGLRHRERPCWGVQFHPESIATSHGRRLLANFRAIAERTPRARAARPGRPRSVVPRRRAAVRDRSHGSALCVRAERLEAAPDPESVFLELHGDDEHAFWLDSSRPGGENGRFSFVGGSGGPLAALVTYDVAAREVTVVHGAGSRTDVYRETIFDYLERELERLALSAEGLPFDLACGFVGYLGYELKADCGGSLVHRSPHPDAMLLLADRLIAFDHEDGSAWLACLQSPESAAEAERWLEETRRRLRRLEGAPPLEVPAVQGDPAVAACLVRSRETYLDDVERCKDALRDGETYEVCLTNKAIVETPLDPLRLHRVLRRLNPAPFAALLRLGGLSVSSSSPERFLRVGADRRVEAKPIKGTAPRGRTPAEDAALAEGLRASEKDRAENLMITDLVRNDLGLVCEVGSVHVPSLFAVESFETVHQLVSTVRGRLRSDLSAVDCVRACFPGGSMTGAPKRRTMEIIDELEGEARGVYSGAIGYLSLTGAVDLSIAIRTAVTDGEITTIGTGGAIVIQSDPEAEYREMLLKAEVVTRAVASAAEPVGAERSAPLAPARR